ncbi:MAG TPA: TolC family protein [Wenzhouxiangellaceae bacterium]|nr:TolC family protein [Wenzhouxiangellaceae bacterium]
MFSRSIKTVTALAIATVLMSLSLASAGLQAQAEAPTETADSLSLEQAVRIAVEREDPAITRLEARAEALEERAVSDAQLPDPKVTGQLANLPVDSFAFDESMMTQVKFGLRQEFPAGRSRAIKGQQRRLEASVERARKQLELRRIALETRQAWMDLAYNDKALEIVSSGRDKVARQIESISARFATGRMSAQDVLRAELELSLLDDRMAEHRRQADAARATLSRYIGRNAFLAPDAWPKLDVDGDAAMLRNRLAEHPAVNVENAEVEVADAGVSLAEQAYKPALAIEGGYGIRTDQADFASVGVTLSMPLFTDKRQDRRRAAAVSRRGAEQFDRDAVLLDLRRQLDQALSDWQRYKERVALYRSALGERARQTAEASITTYANGQTDFAELIRSQLAELEVALKRAELEARAGRAWARIVYLAGDVS